MRASRKRTPRLPTALLGLPVGVPILLLIGVVICVATLFGSTGGCGTGSVSSVPGVPAKLIPIYVEAAASYGLGSQGSSVLAAINRVETDFGRDTSTSSAGAIGWMQFKPSTWATYGVDADGEGVENPDDPWDAIFAAARYLRASGAPGDWQTALFAYNHAEWYVAEVLADAQRLQGAMRLQAAALGDCATAN
jgi:hypothetical protein